MSNPVRTFVGVTRLGVGGVSLLAPGLSADLFGIGKDGSNDFVTRLFGSRELALASVLLAAQGPDVRRAALLGAGIDAIDVLSGLVEWGRGRLSTYGVVIGAGGAALFAGLGLLVARDAQRAA